MDVGAPNFKPWRWFFYTQVDIPASGITPQHFVFRKQFTFRAYLAHLREFPSVWIVLGRFQSFPANMHLRTWKHALDLSPRKKSMRFARRHLGRWRHVTEHFEMKVSNTFSFHYEVSFALIYKACSICTPNMHGQYARPICTRNIRTRLLDFRNSMFRNKYRYQATSVCFSKGVSPIIIQLC